MGKSIIFAIFFIGILQFHGGSCKSFGRPVLDLGEDKGPPVIETTTAKIPTVENERIEDVTDIHDDDSESASVDDDYSSEEDGVCPQHMFYHSRGRQCVPMRCRGGNKNRDWHTGLCAIEEDVQQSSWMLSSNNQHLTPYDLGRNSNSRRGRLTAVSARRKLQRRVKTTAKCSEKPWTPFCNRRKYMNNAMNNEV